MCLILFAVKPNPKYRLVVAANRDEFYSRPAYPARLWDDHPEVLDCLNDLDCEAVIIRPDFYIFVAVNAHEGVPLDDLLTALEELSLV